MQRKERACNIVERTWVVRRIKGRDSNGAHSLVLGGPHPPPGCKYVEPADLASPDGSFLCLQMEGDVQKRLFLHVGLCIFVQGV